MSRLFTNEGTTTLWADASAIATVLTIGTGEGLRFPAPTGSESFDIRIFNKATATVERARVTTRATDSFTVVVRGLYGSTALDLQAGDIIELIQTAEFLTDLAQKADIQSGTAVYALTTGGTTAYAITLAPVPTGYGAGMHLSAKINATNTGASTLDINTLGARSIKKVSAGALADISAGDLVIDTVAEFRDNGTYLQLLNPASGSVPIGGIMMWSGSIVSIPTGWALCDGSASTPDLRDRFVMGAGTTYNPDDTGGSADAAVVAHTHTGTTGGGGSHRHTLPSNTAFSQTLDGWDSSAVGGANQGWALSGQYTGYESAHTHSITTDSTGVSATGANLPPYYALAFIMYTG